jgi:hypothetical protein
MDITHISCLMLKSSKRERASEVNTIITKIVRNQGRGTVESNEREISCWSCKDTMFISNN